MKRRFKMSNDDKIVTEGYTPAQKGYKPKPQSPVPANPTPSGGYQPTYREDNPANTPPPAPPTEE